MALSILSVKQVESLPVLSLPVRLAIAAKSQAEQFEFWQTSELYQAVEVRLASQIQPLSSKVRLLVWNAQYCRYIEDSAKVLAGLGADVLLLSEMDYGLDRSGQHHTTARLAESLGCGYVYGVEVLSLADSPINVGYRGNAILSRAAFVRPGLIRLSDKASQSIRNRAIVSRLAVLATIRVGSQDVVFASIHLENQTSPAARASQLELLLQAIDDYAPGCPAVVAGDMNSLSFEITRDNYKDPDTFRQLIKQDPDRFLNPIPHEPLFDIARQHGYSWEDSNIIRKSTHRCNYGPFSLRGNTRNLDWFFVRGLRPVNPRVVDATMVDIDWALSDHEIICLDIETEAT